MRFEDYIKEGKVVCGKPDFQKAKALIKMSEMNLKSSANLPLTAISSSSIFGMLYESLRQILEAIALCEGYKVYSHEAYTSLLIEKNEPATGEAFDRFRKIRNAANYYGEPVTVATTLDASQTIPVILKSLITKYLNSLIK